MPHEHSSGGSGGTRGAEDIRLVALVGARQIANARYTVTTTATRIASENPNRRTVIVQNIGAASIYLGNEFVNTGNGYPLAANASLVFELSGELFAICETGTVEVATLTEGDT